MFRRNISNTAKIGFHLNISTAITSKLLKIECQDESYVLRLKLNIFHRTWRFPPLLDDLLTDNNKILQIHVKSLKNWSSTALKLTGLMSILCIFSFLKHKNTPRNKRTATLIKGNVVIEMYSVNSLWRLMLCEKSKAINNHLKTKIQLFCFYMHQWNFYIFSLQVCHPSLSQAFSN